MCQPSLPPTPSDTSLPTGGSQLLSRRTVLKAGAAALALWWLPALSGHPRMAAQVDPKRIYIAPDDHTDLFWTASDEDYRQAFVDMLDYYLDLADATDGNPPDFQSRWNCDGSYWLWCYEQAKSPEEFERLIARIRSGHISAPLNALVVCQGGAPAEAILRGMYYAGKIERRSNLRFPLAIAMENQTLPYGLGALWAGAGAKYSWKGICNCDTRILDAADREHEIYWWEGPDGSRILMKWYSMASNNFSIGGYAEAHFPADVIEYVDTDPDFLARYPYRVIGAFGHGWDNFSTMTEAFVDAAEAGSNEERRVRVSNEEDFFVDFEAIYGQELPVVAASFGNEWDLYCAAMTEVTASVRRATEGLRGAEALATLVSAVEPDFMSGREPDRDLAWMNLGLFWEHNWGVVTRYEEFGEQRIAWQRRLADEIQQYVDSLQADGAAALGRLIPAGGEHPSFYAFNPLSWTRTDFADFPYENTDPVHVIDQVTGQEVPSQFVSLDGQRCLRILARDIPPLGYRVYEARPGPGQAFTDAADVITANTTAFILENDRYRLTVADRGAITSLLDRQRDDREFTRHSGDRDMNDLDDTGPGSGTLAVEDAGPVSVTVRAASSLPLKHTSRITLFREIDRIAIHNQITENFDDTYTWGFGFNVEDPDVWHEEVGAVIRAKLTTDGGHYSPRNARYDWLSLGHFADISGPDGLGATLSNADCAFWRFGVSTAEELMQNRSQISPLAGGRVVGAIADAGIRQQGGDSLFLQRFALQTRPAYDPAGAMRFALAHQNPLITGPVTSENPVYPPSTYSLLQVSHPDVLIWSLKPADDTVDIIIRLWNFSPEEAAVDITFNRYAVASARRVTHIETPIGDARVVGGILQETVGAHQIKTYALSLAPTGSAGDEEAG